MQGAPVSIEALIIAGFATMNDPIFLIEQVKELVEGKSRMVE
jgi:hypothetical protein